MSLRPWGGDGAEGGSGETVGKTVPRGSYLALRKGSVGKARFCRSAESIGRAREHFYAHFCGGNDCAAPPSTHVHLCCKVDFSFSPFLYVRRQKNRFFFFSARLLFTLRESIIVRRLAFVLWLLMSLADYVPAHRLVKTRRRHKHGAK